MDRAGRAIINILTTLVIYSGASNLAYGDSPLDASSGDVLQATNDLSQLRVNEIADAKLVVLSRYPDDGKPMNLAVDVIANVSPSLNDILAEDLTPSKVFMVRDEGLEGGARHGVVFFYLGNPGTIIEGQTKRNIAFRVYLDDERGFDLLAEEIFGRRRFFKFKVVEAEGEEPKISYSKTDYIKLSTARH